MKKGMILAVAAMVSVLLAGPDGPLWAEGLSWSVERIDPETSLGASHDSGLAVSSDGTPHVAYMFRTDSGYQIRHAAKVNGAWQVETVESAANVGDRVVLAFDANNQLHIAYNYLNINGGGGVVRYGTLSPGGWQLQTVSPANVSARLPNMALDADGRPRLSFFDNGGAGFASYYAALTNAGWAVETIPPTGPYGFGEDDVAVNAAGNPVVSGYRSGGRLQVTTRSSLGVWSLEDVGVGGYLSSVVLDASGNPMVAHTVNNTDDLMFARKTNGTWTNDLITNLGPGASRPCLALDAHGNPRMTFEMRVNSLGPTSVCHAYLTGAGWVMGQVDSAMSFGSGPSLAITPDGVSHVVYTDLSGSVCYATAQVPEPCTLALLAAGGWAILRRRRRPEPVEGRSPGRVEEQE